LAALNSFLIILVALLLQITAAFLALRLIRLTGRRRAWILIAAAVGGMAVRRLLALYASWDQESVHLLGDTRSEELVALITSALMVAGMAMIRPIFLDLQRSEEQLKESRERYRSVFELSRDAIVISSMNGRIEDVNPAAATLFGCSRRELIGSDFNRRHADPERQTSFERLIAADGFVSGWEAEMTTRHDRTIQCEIGAALRKSSSGEILGYQSILRDVTERKQAQKALSESKELLDAILAASAVGICMVRNRKVKWANHALLSILGYEPSEVIGQSARIAYPSDEEFLRVGKELIPKLKERGLAAMDARWLRKGGEEIHVYLQAQVLDANDFSRGFIASATDITERKRSSEALERSEEKYRMVLDHAGEAIFVAREGRILFCNPMTEKLFGIREAELTRIPYTELLQAEDQITFKALDERHLTGHACSTLQTVRFTSKDGRSGWLEMSAVPVVWDGLPASLVFVRDITRQRDLERQLLHSQKMEAIGRLAGGVAHDFNNLLLVINGYSEMALQNPDCGGHLREVIQGIHEAGESAAALTRRLLAFSHQRSAVRKRIDLNEVVSGMDRILRRVIGEDIELILNLEKELWSAEGDPGEFEQVIMNLVVNARDAMPKGGELTIETANVTLTVDYTEEHIGLSPGRHVMLTVSDTGKGMDPFVQSRLFEPFFTTKEMGQGSGLGLSIVYGIVRKYGGSIHVYSELDQGTTFKAYFPPCGPRRQGTGAGNDRDRAAKGSGDNPPGGGRGQGPRLGGRSAPSFRFPGIGGLRI
jgi:two-component system cell cycle sensor histidine kinase/response regulator CckA